MVNSCSVLHREATLGNSCTMGYFQHLPLQLAQIIEWLRFDTQYVFLFTIT